MSVNYLALWQVGCNAVMGDILVLGHQEDVKQFRQNCKVHL
jgi:hypothetical protein